MSARPGQATAEAAWEMTALRRLLTRNEGKLRGILGKYHVSKDERRANRSIHGYLTK